MYSINDPMGGPSCLTWSGYEGLRTLGWWCFIDWPDTHPDSHCVEGKYTPVNDTTRECRFCGWVPPDTFYRGRDIRKEKEISSLWKVICERHYDSYFFEAYLVYVDGHREFLTRCPTYDSVMNWWEGLSLKVQLTYESIYIGLCPMPDFTECVLINGFYRITGLR